jgi:hypothetical protein
MKYYGVDDQYLLQPESAATLPSWESKYTRSFLYAEDTGFMWFGSISGWALVGSGLAGGYVHTQSVASASWSVVHGLNNTNAVVTVYDSDNKVIVPDEITSVDADNITITFSEAIAGFASVVSASSGSVSFSTQQINLPKGSSFSDHDWKGTAIYGTNGEATTINRGELCYCKLNSSAWKYYRYDANGTDKLILPTCIAVEAIESGADGRFLMEGVMRDDTWSLSGTADVPTTVYASAATAGALTMTAPPASRDEVVVAGFLIAASTVRIKIGYAWLEVK